MLNIIGNTLLNKTKDTGAKASNPQRKPFVATGGVIQNFQSGSVVFTSHTFTSSGVFTIVDGETNANVLVVAGGGGGRSGSLAGVGGEGGGAGGYVNSGSYFFTKNLFGPSTFIAQVGAGGAQNQNGVSSSFVSTYGYEEIVPIYALGGGAGSGSGGSGGGEGFTLDINQGNDGGFRYPSTSPNNNQTSSYYSAPAGGSYITTGSAMTPGSHKYWRILITSGSSSKLTEVYLTSNYTYSGSLAGIGQLINVWTTPPAPYAGGFPVPGCADYPNTCWRDRNTYDQCAIECGTPLTSSGAIEYYNAGGVSIDNVIIRAGQDLSGTPGSCDGSAQGGNAVAIVQYKDNDGDAWTNHFSGSLLTQPSAHVYTSNPYQCGVGGAIDTTGRSGNFGMVSRSFYEGGNIAGTPGQSIGNTWIDGTNVNWYSGGGGGGAWSGVASGSAYIKDENATGALNAGVGGESGSLNGTNAAANSGCGGGGGATNNTAALRGTGGSGGSGIVVITYLSGSAF